MKKCIYYEWYVNDVTLSHDIYFALLKKFDDKTEEVFIEGKIYEFPREFIVEGLTHIEDGDLFLTQDDYVTVDYFEDLEPDDEKIILSDFILSNIPSLDTDLNIIDEKMLSIKVPEELQGKYLEIYNLRYNNVPKIN